MTCTDARTRERCWRNDWVVEFDIKGAFDNIDHELLMKAVRKHTPESWLILYIGRWLEAPVLTSEGEKLARTQGVPQGGVISPLLMNLFMHYAFDNWMQTTPTMEDSSLDLLVAARYCKSDESGHVGMVGLLWQFLPFGHAKCL